MDAQKKGLSEEELNELTEKVSGLPCPICLNKENRLNASKIAIAQSVILVTTFDDPLLIACPDCIVLSAKKATKKTLFFGWWAIP